MNKRMITMCLACTILILGSSATADSFGTGANQFTIDFVTISGDTNPASGYGIVNNDYRMGVYEIINDQWDKFKASLGVPVTGDLWYAYNQDPYWTGSNVPTNNVSWYEAAQFVNYLNVSTGHQPAYKFTGTQGTSNYALGTWNTSEAASGTNLYRHKDAFYYIPTEDEWVKAGYWNGTTLQTYATKAGEFLHQGDGVSGTGWNYDAYGYGIDTHPWDVGSGSEELNGTYDMMGNVIEWMESPYDDYGADSTRVRRGGSFHNIQFPSLTDFWRVYYGPDSQHDYLGFRVASEVPEPATLLLLCIGGAAMLRRKKRG